jgi:hypothetical protein
MKHTRILAAAAAVVLVATSAQAQGRGRGRGHDKKDDREQRQDGQQISQQEMQRRIDEQRQRQSDYQQHLDAQVRAAQARSAQIQNQRRAAQYNQAYAQRLQQQQQELRAQRDYSRDPYFSTPPSYRYTVNGTTRQTNQYGADVLKQAVNVGYQQGVQAAQADRADGIAANYQRSFAYQDANYGYTGNYVAQSDYNYYFRQGFRRGYTDGYGTRAQYGTVTNGSSSILGNILNGILGLRAIP